MSTYIISQTWDGSSLPSEDVVSVSLEEDAESNGLRFKISAPFYDDPKPAPSESDEVAPANKPENSTWKLWDYEVVEIFFLNDLGEYLELEFGPHGHYLVLLLREGEGHFRTHLPLAYTAHTLTDEARRWEGEAVIPADYFPPHVTKMNSYSIHGGSARQYHALYPVPSGKYDKPNFHRLDYFQPISDFTGLVPGNMERSRHWSTAS